jgi:opacity protein-like surface antigen
MKKTLLTIALSLAVSSVAMAAPITDLHKDEIVAGYIYWNPKLTANEYGYSADFGKTTANGAYVETAIDNKTVVGIETIQGSQSATLSGMKLHADTRFTDLTVQYKLDNKIRLIAGNRSYDTTLSLTSQGGSYSSEDTKTNKFIYGIGAVTNLGKTDDTTAYASILHSDIADDWQVGVNHKFSKQISMNVNYRSYSEDDLKLKGVGAGLSYKF